MREFLTETVIVNYFVAVYIQEALQKFFRQPFGQLFKCWFYPGGQEFQKTRLNATIGNRDYHPYTLKRKKQETAFFEFDFYFQSVKTVKNAKNER